MGLDQGTFNYLSCLVMPRKHRYEPRPQYQGQLQIPEAPLKSYGERSFGFSAPTEWNKLPIDVRSALTLVYLSRLNSKLIYTKYATNDN